MTRYYRREQPNTGAQRGPDPPSSGEQEQVVQLKRELSSMDIEQQRQAVLPPRPLSLVQRKETNVQALGGLVTAMTNLVVDRVLKDNGLQKVEEASAEMLAKAILAIGIPLTKKLIEVLKTALGDNPMQTLGVALLKALGFKPTEAIPLIELINPARLAMEPYPSWFHGDAKKDDLLPFVDTAHLTTLKTNAGPFVKPLAVTDVGTKPAHFGELIGTKENFQKWVVETQMWAGLLKHVAASADAAMYNKIKAGGRFDNLIADFKTQLAGGEKTNAKAALDTLFDKIPDGDLAQLKKVFEARYDLTLTHKGGGSDWGPKGLRRIYSAFKVIPDAQVELIKNFKRSGSSKDDASGSSSWGGVKRNISVDYKESGTERTETGTYTGSATDAMRGMNVLDSTTVHELGHQVDNPGSGGSLAEGKLSGRDDFKNIDGWKRYAPGSAGTLLADMESTITNGYGTPLNDKEKIVAHDAVLEMIKNKEEEEDDLEDRLEDAYDAKNMKHGGKKTFWTRKVVYRSVNDLLAQLWAAKIPKQVVFGQSGSPWAREPRNTIGTKQYHTAYGMWFGYNTSAHNSRMSLYAFNDPSDTFAELYATWYCSRPVGSKVPDKYKKWFKDRGLDK